jgi:dihydrodiol dehydrogenase / D-xylose 1-dehydrogenase (NADP)
VQGDFGFVCPPEVKRMWDIEMAGGAMLDIGIYLVQAATMVFGPTVPEQVKCTGQLADTGVDSEDCVALTWNGKGSANLMATVSANTPEELLIVCSKGYLRLKSPAHCPSQVIIAREEGRGKFAEEVFECPLPPCPPQLKANYPNSEGMFYQVQAVEECLAKGLLECPEMTLDDTLAIVKIMDQCRKQVGVVYSADK